MCAEYILTTSDYEQRQKIELEARVLGIPNTRYPCRNTDVSFLVSSSNTFSVASSIDIFELYAMICIYLHVSFFSMPEGMSDLDDQTDYCNCDSA